MTAGYNKSCYKSTPSHPGCKESTDDSHPRIRAPVGAVRRGPQPARAEAREPLGRLEDFGHKVARAMAAHQRAESRDTPVRERSGIFLLGRASGRGHAD